MKSVNTKKFCFFMAENAELPLDKSEDVRYYTFRSKEHAPLAQLVEHLTLNQGVPGSSP